VKDFIRRGADSGWVETTLSGGPGRPDKVIRCEMFKSAEGYSSHWKINGEGEGDDTHRCSTVRRRQGISSAELCAWPTAVCAVASSDTISCFCAPLSLAAHLAARYPCLLVSPGCHSCVNTCSTAPPSPPRCHAAEA
jgi:hypothetical protein